MVYEYNTFISSFWRVFLWDKTFFVNLQSENQKITCHDTQ